MTMTENQANEARHEEHPVIIIDDVSYEAPKNPMKGTELRALADPPIEADRDLWLEKRDGNDELIKEAENVRLRTGDRFFSTPRHINPGRRSI
jgi:hypothetical protein